METHLQRIGARDGPTVSAHTAVSRALGCKSLHAAEPITFRLPADNKNENSKVISGVALSPDGKLVAAAFGKFYAMFGDPKPGQTVLWDARTAQRRATLEGHRDGVSAVAFSKSGNLIATGGHLREINLWWSTKGPTLIATMPTSGEVTSLVFSPDDKFLAAGIETFGANPQVSPTAELYDVVTRKVVRRFEHEWGVLAIAFAPKGDRLATSSSDGTVRIWNVATGLQIARIRSRTLDDATNTYYRMVVKNRKLTAQDVPVWIESVTFSPDGRRLALAAGQTARARKRLRHRRSDDL